ncbi:hypothetical protein L21SP5_01723 [Salinivirga cyanobacteriivorans]|uniref:DUF1573 domain-containing protein n=1 Tax=Salinivirga cyanobacteriivorans TaxID=1307839 RepID=A0A0S2HZP6_9BACT|nr:hypothetical protein L21SP5_01723 [Salinivirga cyanobacteriivorans]
MKIRIITFILIFLVISCKRKSNTIVFAPQRILTYNFYKKSNSIDAQFKIFNVGENDLKIDSIITDCSCIVTEITKRQVKPNDSTQILVRYENTHPGVFQQNVFVFCNIDYSPLLLTLQGEVERKK